MRLLIVGLLFLSSAVFAQARNPVGEQADYVVVNDPARTSSMIRSGTLDATVTEHLPDAENGEAFEVLINYDFVIQFYGRQSGSRAVEVPAEYFGEDFIRSLRQRGTYEHEKFKMRHDGFADAQNQDGQSYPSCDIVTMYDIDTGRDQGSFLPELAGIENLQIKLHIFHGTPVLGAVKIDVSGEYSGMPIKAGGDLIR